MSEVTAAIEILIKLKDVKPAVSRKLIVPVTIRYDQLHVLLQLAFGWTNSHLYNFQVNHQKDLEYVPYMDDMSFENQILADQAYVYPDLQKDEVLNTYDFGESWEHVITLKRVLAFDEIQGVQVPSCTWSRGANLAEDGQDAAYALPFDRQSLNDQFALWSHAGEQMIRADDLGLLPKLN
ncbi:plasmid pRiA4b ORF-3 family protein [Levilactobacillus sp. N40-8-2]|uniref:plasmid pRiA4b ORF-3 family protein n=1 Tax=Levilactobacillus muriae TaxID=3238987 RepID=UPI0038B35328